MKYLFILFMFVVCVGIAVGQGKTAIGYLSEGSTSFVAGDFKKAIPAYEKALALEKAKRTLNKTQWGLVDNLGSSYGITGRTTPGNMKKAKEMFEYGISKDPDYPIFYYSLACTYSEMNNMDKAIDYLRLAFARKNNLVRGAKMPTPAVDPSFQRFINNDRFMSVLQELS
ncbi:MAG: tetratricopeptide repeat protein [Pyrinomonadaceae bacterium]